MGKCCRVEKYEWCRHEETTYKDTDDKEYCIYHTPLSLRKEQNLTHLFTKSLDRIPKGQFDLSGCEFEDSSFFTVSNYVLFKVRDCIFNGPLILTSCHIQNCDLTGATFKNVVDFSKTTFGKDKSNKIIFDEASFLDIVDFIGCSFLSEFNFNGVTYSSNLHFLNVVFSMDAYFLSVKTADNIKKGALFLLKADIKQPYSLHIADSNFCYAAFSIRGGGKFRLLRSTFNDVDISDDLSLSLFQDIDFSTASFLDSTNITEATFKDCRFIEKHNLIGKRYLLFDEIVHLRHLRNISLAALKELYCAFKNNFETKKDYVSADKFHFSELEMQRLILYDSFLLKNMGKKTTSIFTKIKNAIVKPIAFIRFECPFSAYPLYKYVSGYGTSYVTSLFWIVLSLLLFSVIYMFTGVPSETSNIHYTLASPNQLPSWRILLSDFFDAILFALGVLIPSSQKYYVLTPAFFITKKFIILESLVIYSLLPMFIIALKRHFKR